jgi:hypothetical protein
MAVFLPFFGNYFDALGQLAQAFAVPIFWRETINGV